MSENEIKPVAWKVGNSENGPFSYRKTGTNGWRYASPVYDQSAIDRLTADAASLRERMIELERQRDDYLSREWQAEKAKRKAEAERDAAVAERGRYFCDGTEGHFFCDDLELARALVNAYDKDDEWTITDMLNPYGVG